MVNSLNSRSRSIDRRASCLAILVVLSITALVQAQQPILGTSQIQGSVDSRSGGQAEAFPVTANSSGQINSLSLFVDSTSTAGTVSVGVYTSAFGHPQNLLSQAVIPQPMPGQWNSVTIPAAQVKRGRQYWIALLGLNGQIAFRDSTGPCYSQASLETSLTSLPSNWQMGSQNSTCIVSMFGSKGAFSSVSVTVAMSPTSASLQTGQQTQFTATVSGTTNTAVTWTSTGGTVTSGGLYTAPSSNGSYTVSATSAADSTKSASAVITVSQPVSISVAPATVNLQSGAQQQFSASVSGTSNTAVTWSASGGTVSTSGLYVAPSAAGTYSITATSAADSSKSASAVITVSQPVSISVAPATVNLQSGAQQQFSASVSGTSNTAVTWSASGGTVSTSGLYLAPSAAGTYSITATSAADSSKSASAVITVSQPTAITVSISPGTVAMPEKWQLQFAATVSGSSNTTVLWAVKQGTGTITQTGLYTAPQSVETDVIAATSQADATQSASASVSVVAPHSVTLGWSPSSGTSSYNVYRGTTNGGPYSLLVSGVSATSYTDLSVQSGKTYYYVTTAVDSSAMESAYSNMAQAAIPVP